MSAGLRVFVGTPGTRETPTAVWDDFLIWADPDETGKHSVHARTDATAGHLDMSRTRLLRLGLERRCDYIAQRDADVAVEIPFALTMKYLAEDFRDGAGVVFSPTTSLDWQPQFQPMPGTLKSACPNDRPFECDSGAGGFMVMTREVVELLRPVGYDFYSYGPGTEEGRIRVELLCVNRPGIGDVPPVSEDVSLMANVRDSTGLKVICDPRILTSHMKPDRRPSWRPIELVPPEILRRLGRL